MQLELPGACLTRCNGISNMVSAGMTSGQTSLFPTTACCHANAFVSPALHFRHIDPTHSFIRVRHTSGGLDHAVFSERSSAPRGLLYGGALVHRLEVILCYY